MKIIEVKENKKQYLDLLLLADEQEDMVDRYLDNGKMYVLDDNGVKCECVITDKENEEIYGILSGNGKAIIDGEEISLSTGDWLKIAPAAKRQFFASDISGITYICIQVKENSLEHFTAEDAVIG